MDEMKVRSPFLTGIISKVVTKTFKKKTGVDSSIKVNELTASSSEGMTRVHLNIDAEIKTSEFYKFLEQVGL